VTGHWLVKSEPRAYSWDDFERDGATVWDGVRNAEARNNLAAMRVSDRVLFYHSNEGREVVGLARVVRRAYPDPTTDDERWLAVDLAPMRRLAQPVSLPTIKAEPRLRRIRLVTHSRLSVMPLREPEFERIVALGARPQRAAASRARVSAAGSRKPARPRTRSSAPRRGP
jgi:predicted RNA-binding protein with PUA-like domain